MAQFVADARGLPTRRGWSWIAEGWKLFKRRPVVWIVMMLILAVIFIVLALIPVVGALASFVLTPVFVAGIAMGCRALDEGRELELGHLFAGFRTRSGVLVTVGLLYLAACFAIALIAGAVAGPTLASMPTNDPAAIAQAARGMLLPVLIAAALFIPVLMAVWFAPPLVVFHDQGAMPAIKLSFAACLKNVLPFLWYGVILLALGFIASIPAFLGWIVLAPVMFTSFYASYRDIFLNT
jgi:uncharacterized membrane protein